MQRPRLLQPRREPRRPHQFLQRHVFEEVEQLEEWAEPPPEQLLDQWAVVVASVGSVPLWQPLVPQVACRARRLLEAQSLE